MKVESTASRAAEHEREREASRAVQMLWAGLGLGGADVCKRPTRFARTGCCWKMLEVFWVFEKVGSRG